jgi:predicted transcriptional regulator
MSSWEKYSESIESSRIYHERYHKAVANPKRKKILELIEEGKGEAEIADELNISMKELEYHLKILEWGFCIEREGEGWKLTKEGEVIEYLRRR